MGTWTEAELIVEELSVEEEEEECLVVRGVAVWEGVLWVGDLGACQVEGQVVVLEDGQVEVRGAASGALALSKPLAYRGVSGTEEHQEVVLAAVPREVLVAALEVPEAAPKEEGL